MAKNNVAGRETAGNEVVTNISEDITASNEAAAGNEAVGEVKGFKPAPKTMLRRTPMMNKKTGEQEKSKDGQLMYDYIVNYVSMGRTFKVKLTPPKIDDNFNKKERFKKITLRQSYEVLDIIYYNTDEAELVREVDSNDRISYFVQNPDPELEGEMVVYPMAPENYKTDGEVLERYFKLVKAGKVS